MKHEERKIHLDELAQVYNAALAEMPASRKIATYFTAGVGTLFSLPFVTLDTVADFAKTLGCSLAECLAGLCQDIMGPWRNEETYGKKILYTIANLPLAFLKFLFIKLPKACYETLRDCGERLVARVQVPWKSVFFISVMADSERFNYALSAKLNAIGAEPISTRFGLSKSIQFKQAEGQSAVKAASVPAENIMAVTNEITAAVEAVQKLHAKMEVTATRFETSLAATAARLEKSLEEKFNTLQAKANANPINLTSVPAAVPATAPAAIPAIG